MNNSLCIRLISLYRDNKCLWDPYDSNYAKKSVREDAWRQISRKMNNMPTEDLKKKMRSLSGGYRRERFREKHSRLTGSGAYKSKWFAYDYFAFMADKNDPGPTRDIRQQKQVDENVEESNDQDHDGNTDHSDEDTEFIQEAIIIKTEPEDEPPPKRVLHYRKPRAVRPTRPSFKRHFLTRERDRSLTEPYVKPSPVKGKDECDSFGEYIAVSLRKHDERTRSMIKQAINNILFEQEMKKYNSSSFLVEKNPLIIGDSDDCEK
ncbi:uncharacterized protein LOC125060885 isoform X2 [Pieris napi]|uniref:uncharacterized protein LOC125060885 isoform X2 n=1 Tax=Pieris napi TaxID=78633 RepID=UPI001FBAE077|nr:uncharacterized protein LOC125060885 isoform X2 [Pieris napi]